MKSKVFKFLILFFVFHLNGKTQNILFGTIKESKKRNFIKDVKIFNSNDILLTKTDSLGSVSYTHLRAHET